MVNKLYVPEISKIQVTQFPQPVMGEPLANKDDARIGFAYILPEDSVFAGAFTTRIKSLHWKPTPGEGQNAAADTAYTAELELECVKNGDASAPYECAFEQRGVSVSTDAEHPAFESASFDPATSKLYLYFNKTARNTKHKVTIVDFCANAEETSRAVRAMELLARNAGIYGMVGGQCADLEAEKNPQEIGEEGLNYIHKHKTACLIESGFQIGAILAGAPQEDVEKLGRIAENIGIAFQIQDDILDVIGDSKELGKLTGSDEKDGKVTYVTMHGLKKAAEDVRRMSEEALELFDSLTASNDFLRELIQGLITRTK